MGSVVGLAHRVHAKMHVIHFVEVLGFYLALPQKNDSSVVGDMVVHLDVG